MNEVLRFSVGNETKKEKQNLVGKYVLVTPPISSHGQRGRINIELISMSGRNNWKYFLCGFFCSIEWCRCGLIRKRVCDNRGICFLYTR